MDCDESRPPPFMRFGSLLFFINLNPKSPLKLHILVNLKKKSLFFGKIERRVFSLITRNCEIKIYNERKKLQPFLNLGESGAPGAKFSNKFLSVGTSQQLRPKCNLY